MRSPLWTCSDSISCLVGEIWNTEGRRATKGYSAAFRRDCRPGLVESAFGVRALCWGQMVFFFFNYSGGKRKGTQGVLGDGLSMHPNNARGKLGFEA